MKTPNANALEYLRGAILREWDADFPRLQKIPSSLTQKTVRYCRLLGKCEKAVLVDAAAKWACQWVAPRDHREDIAHTAAEADAFARLVRAPIFSDETGAPSPTLGGGAAGPLRRSASSAEAASPGASKGAMRPSGSSVKDMRSALDQEAAKRFRDKPRNDSGGLWTCTGSVGSRPVEIRCFFGGKSSMLKYGVTTEYFSPQHRINAPSLESLLGVGLVGWWDSMSEGDSARDMSLLLDLCADTGAMLADLERLMGCGQVSPAV